MMQRAALVLLVALAAGAVEPILVIAEPVDGAITISIEGRLEHAAATTHRLPKPWVPLSWLRSEGARVVPGDVLAGLDTVPIQRNQSEAKPQAEQDERQRVQGVLRSDDELARLQARLADLQAQVVVNRAGIAATRLRDEDELRIAELEGETATATRDQAVRRVALLTPLVAAGQAPASELRAAEDRARQAEAALRAPALRLDFLRTTTRSVSRRRIELTTEALLEELGEGDGPARGVPLEVQLARLRQSLAEDLARGPRRQRAFERTRNEQILADPVLRATATGALAWTDTHLRPGIKKPMSSLLLVLADGDLMVSLDLPEDLRALLAGPGASATVSIPALGIDIPGQVAQLGSVPVVASGGGLRTFACRVRLERALSGLLPGMRARCTLRVPVPGGVASLPRFCLVDPVRPRVLLPGGASRALDGVVVGERFVIWQGLSAGDAVVVPPAHARTGGLRLGGTLDADERLPLRLASGGWEVVEVVPDGTMVQRGDLVARLVKGQDGRDAEAERFHLEAGDAKAVAEHAVARLIADQERAIALVAWRKAAVASEQARLELFISGVGPDDETVAAAASTLVGAENAQRRAKERLAVAQAGQAAGATGMMEMEDLSRAVRSADRELLKAQLRLAAARRALDWLDVALRREAVAGARRAELDARQDYALACERRSTVLAGSRARLTNDLRSRDQQRREYADAEVRAPRDGMVMHRTPDGRPLRVGQQVPSQEPFAMPLGSGRVVRLLVPARYYGHFSNGQTLLLAVPVLGPALRTATVRAVGGGFMRDPALAADLDDGQAEEVFTLDLFWDPGVELAARVPPGTTVYVDL